MRKMVEEKKNLYLTRLLPIPINFIRAGKSIVLFYYISIFHFLFFVFI
jgi:hypothetical protein